MSEIIIQTKELTKQYGRKIAIQSLSLDIHAGGLVGLIGRNGSGKTTLMKLWAGLMDKSAGSLTVFDEEPMDNLAVLQRLVYTYHNVEYDKNANLGDVINAFDLIYEHFDKPFAVKLLKYFDLHPKMKYRQMSQGMASIFNFISALACRAELTLLDEPVLGMDVTVRKAAYEVLLRDYGEFPRTIILSSHLLSELEGILSEIILIDQGRLLFYKDIDEIQNMAFRVDGSRDQLNYFVQNKKILYRRNGEFDHFSILAGKLTEEMILDAHRLNLKLSRVRSEDLCVYMTQENKEGELECLWKE